MKNILVYILTLLVAGSAFSQQKEAVDVKEFRKGIKRENAIILDVRTPEEYAEGHLRNSVNINWKNQEEFKARVAGLEKTKAFFVYCRSGSRSEKASEWLRVNGFYNVKDLSGGIQAWEKAGKPVVKNKDQRR
ncbi:rhodanese-like domain-containing protein [Pedobacter sp. SYSU D00535]|uniref:rhodanese-like domain-containing protein n=1 Tax=Pedobacter sp. SYSU D00535 TaxID=2810308 RepID=UPI001A9687EA|nr:rhodanese-like domain-containing protein [Pedobacter sp. SYSU D00535]